MYTPKFNSVAEWAKSLGSSAKTRAGQRKAIIASFTQSHPDKSYLHVRGNRPQSVFRYTLPGGSVHEFGTRAAYLSNRTIERQQRFADSHPLTLSMPAPATLRDVRGNATIQVSLLDLQAEPNRYADVKFARVGEWWIRQSEDVTRDYDRYSKAWHRSHGPAITVNARTVHIRRVRPDGTLETRDVQVAAWRGNYILDALAKAGIVETHKGKMSLRLHAAYDLTPVGQGRRISVYLRTLAGQPIDYVASCDNLVYHAATIESALRGLRVKARKASLRAGGRLITYDLCRRLGFCQPGIADFCRAFDLDPDGEYSPSQIAERVMSNPSAAAPFETELRTLAATVGYAIPAGL